MPASTSSATAMQPTQPTYPGCITCDRYTMAVKQAHHCIHNFEHFLQQQLNFRPREHYQQLPRYIPEPRHVHRVISGFAMDNYHYVHSDAKPVMHHQHGTYAEGYSRLLHPQPERHLHFSSCFADNFDCCRPEEAVLYNPAAPGPMTLPPLAGHQYNDAKVDKADSPFQRASTLSPDANHRGNGMDLPTTGAVRTHVDPAQYERVHPEDWNTALCDEDDDLASPLTVESPGVHTPGFNDLDDTIHRQHGLPSTNLGSSFGSNMPEMFSNHQDRLFGIGGTIGAYRPKEAQPRYIPEPLQEYRHLNGLGISNLPGVSHGTSSSFGTMYGHEIEPVPAVAPVEIFRHPSMVSSFAGSHTSSMGSFSSDGGLASLSEGEAERDNNPRTQRDRNLVELRRQGKSYREIKRILRCSEAESTLRGRMRVLTKPKEDRVRKPEWEVNDLELLRKAVEKYDTDGGNLPWKKMSRWMKSKGSSYEFAPATCAKKWQEIEGEL